MDTGFREIEHRADWELEVWAPDYLTLLKQAAMGMYALSGACFQLETRVYRSLSLPLNDPESLLVRFLGELVFLSEQEELGFDDFDLRLESGWLQVRLTGAPIISQRKEIKAVTYHNLAIRQTERGLEVNIVFDV